MIRLNLAVFIPLLALHLVLPSAIHAQPAQYDLDVKELDRRAGAPAPKQEKKKPKKTKKPAAARPAAAGEEAERPRYRTYVVKSGDHIFRILMVKFGMSNEQAEALIPEIIRTNHISNIRNLQVGSKLLIPGRVQARPPKAGSKEAERKKAEAAEADAMLEAATRLEAQSAGAPTPAPTPARPAPAAPSAAASPAMQASPASPAPTWVCPVTDRDPGRIVESVLSALSISWCRNRIIQSDRAASIVFSIRVDRYFEYKEGRYIISIGDGDAYTYNLLKLLENSGYRVLRLGAQEDLRTVGEKLLTMLGVLPDFGRHALPGGKEATGFLLRPGDAGGRQVVITAQVAEPGEKWVLAPGCGVR